MTIINDVFLGRQFVLDFAAIANVKSKNKLREKITKHNGVISYTVTKNSDYVVRPSQSTDEVESFKTSTANKYNIPVVKEGFIDACLDNGHLLDCNEYLCNKQAGETNSGLDKGKIQPESFEKTNKTKEKNVKVKMWNYKDENGPNFHEKSHHIIKAVLFTGKMKTQGSPFALLELHVKDGKENGDSHRFCLFLHQGYLPSIPGSKECRYFHTSDVALNAFTNLWKQLTKPPNSMKKETRFPEDCSFHLGSDQLAADEWFTCAIPHNSGTQHFVDLIWDEADKKLEEELSRDWRHISSDEIEKAAGYLSDIDKSAENLTNDYLREINRPGYRSLKNNPKKVLEEFNILQLLRDMKNLSELSESADTEYESKYRALRCAIEYLEIGSNDYNKIKSLIGSEPNIIVKNAYRINRSEENEAYTKDIGNDRMLFHGTSYSNIVSILSRGLLLPRISGDSSDDAGLDLGLGLYFASDVNGLLKYAIPSGVSGTRLLLVHQVALGISYETCQKMPHLKKPPQGFDSVHGVKQDGGESCFEKDEYVIYSEKQQRICYVVEFQLSDDEVMDTKVYAKGEKNQRKTKTKTQDDQDDQDGQVAVVDLDDILHARKMREKVGLQSIKGENKVVLKNVSIHGQLFDLAAQVVVLQEYFNESSSVIQAKYFFPIDEMAAVCNFEAFLNGRHVIGRVDEKEQARKDYSQAVSSGKSALLMDQIRPDLFSISVGNIQPMSTVLIKITYVTELDLEGDSISFRLPATVCSRPEKKHDETAVNISEVKTSLELSLEMPYDIRSVTSSTHLIKVKKTDTAATIKMEENQQFDERGFQLLVTLSEIHCPRMWTEEDEEKGTQACMLTFYPEFETGETHGMQTQVVLIVDASNSMQDSFTSAQKLATLCLRNLPLQCAFNVVSFGSTYEELFPDCLTFSLELVEEAKHFISKLRPTKGDSFAKSIFRSNFLLGPSPDTTRNILFISDGHLNDRCENLLESIRANCVRNGSARIFTLAVGSAPNRHLMRNLAKVGAGEFETFDNIAMKSNWLEKIERLMQKVEMPVLADIFVEWQIFDENKNCTLIQAPRNVMTLFNGSRLVVYGVLKDASTTMAVLKARVPGGREMSTVVSPYESAKSRGKIIHRLAVRALVRDWESGALDADRTGHESAKRGLKSTLVELGKSYSIVSPFTSFVAIDENDSSVVGGLQISFQELVERESVDGLTYLFYDDQDGGKRKPTAKTVAFDVVDGAPSPPIGRGSCISRNRASPPQSVSKFGHVQALTMAARQSTAGHLSLMAAPQPGFGGIQTTAPATGFGGMQATAPATGFSFNQEQSRNLLGSAGPVPLAKQAPNFGSIKQNSTEKRVGDVQAFKMPAPRQPSACDFSFKVAPQTGLGGIQATAPATGFGDIQATALATGFGGMQATAPATGFSFNQEQSRDLLGSAGPVCFAGHVPNFGSNQKNSRQLFGHVNYLMSAPPPAFVGTQSSAPASGLVFNQENSIELFGPQSPAPAPAPAPAPSPRCPRMRKCSLNDDSIESAQPDDLSTKSGRNYHSQIIGLSADEMQQGSEDDFENEFGNMYDFIDDEEHVEQCLLVATPRTEESDAESEDRSEEVTVKRKRGSTSTSRSVSVERDCPTAEFESVSDNEAEEEEIRHFKKKIAKKRCGKTGFILDEDDTTADELSQQGRTLETELKQTKKQTDKCVIALKDDDFLWVSVDDGCINYASGLPFFSTLLKRLGPGPLVKDYCKELVKEFMTRTDPEEYFSVLILDAYKSSVANPPALEWNEVLGEDIKSQLSSKGFNSLPNSNKAAVLIIIASTSFVFEMLYHICRHVLPLRLNDLENIKRTVEDVVNAVMNGPDDSYEALQTTLQVVVTLNGLYPMLYRTLDIGRCWEEAHQRLTKGSSLIVSSVFQN